jgi:arylsulfatase A-like enzyme
MTKNNLYETAHRIPLLIRWPSAIPANTDVDEMISNVDFQQTILGLLGVQASGREQGRDASPLIRGEKAPWRDEVFLHHNTLDRAGIFTDQYELAFVRGRDAVLFDRLSDPEQVRNLYSQPEYREVIRDLTHRILEHHRQLASPSLHWLESIEESLSGGS